MLPIQHLLPLRAVNITLQFTASAAPRPYHHLALTAWLRHLIGEVPHYEKYITLDAPECGHIAYQAGDFYRFTLFGLGGSEALLQHILDCLTRLPNNVKIRDEKMPFRDNLIFHAAQDLLSQELIETVEQLSPYTYESLQQETDIWMQYDQCWINWISPVRLSLPLPLREHKHRENRFCRHRSQLDFANLNNRLYDTLADLLRLRVVDMPPRITDKSKRLELADVFWLDYSYYNVDGREKPMGGLLGRLLLNTEDMPLEQWLYWVLGQYVGIGQRRSFGWGRYQLMSMEGGRTVPRSLAMSSLVEVACELDNLVEALAEIRDAGASRLSSHTCAWEPEEDYAGVWEPEDEEESEGRLAYLREQLLADEYVIPSLHERTLWYEDGSKRLLQVPPFWDRVVQRAVAQVLTPALDALMYTGSFGFRRGRSRHSATQMIQKAYREGYRWVLESDVDDFFPNIQWTRLYTRLLAFFGDDAVVDLVMGWMTANLDGKEREIGLPLGSPLSPVLANIMLDDFDSDLEHAGLLLVRFADDFVVLTKTEKEAEAAKSVVIESLAEVGLKINVDKTGVRSFAQGFRFLGYMFVNSLAVDVGGEKKKISDAGASRLGSYAGAREPEPAVRNELVMGVGELGEMGTMVFVTGVANVVSTLDERLKVTSAAESKNIVDFSWPWHSIQAVLLLGPQHITTPALRAAMQHKVPVHFANQEGFYQGCTWNGAAGAEDSRLWLAQVVWFGQEDNQLKAARLLVAARLRHQREVLRLRNLHHRFDDELKQLGKLVEQSKVVMDLNSLLGIEGHGAKVYFQALQQLLPAWVGFEGRKRKPPPDPFNVLLSIGYTMLFAHVETVIRMNGLLPWVGLYHKPHGNHAVLASDLMEPFRHLVERVALNAIVKKKLVATDFFALDNHGCRLKNEARRRYLALLSERFETPFRSLHLKDSEKLYEHLQWQVQSLRFWMLGKQDSFMVWQGH